MEISKVKTTVQLSNNLDHSCRVCRKSVPQGEGKFGDAINHYLVEHHYQLLHVGQETHHNIDGTPYQTTVAVLGS